MICKVNQRVRKTAMRNKIFFILFAAIGILTSQTTLAQTPSASPSPSSSGSDDSVTVGGYEVTSSVELGIRGLDVNGNHDKYRSDFNYKSGFRIFDSSFFMENKSGDEKLFDSVLITSTGWGADPNGAVRVNVEKVGAYSFDGNVRRVHYYNQLFNHALGWKGANTKRNYGDFDLTIFPQNEKFRLRMGLSFYNTKGDAGFTTRPFGDEFPITRNVDINSLDLRTGIDFKLAGFKMGFTLGNRHFKDGTDYTLRAPSSGLNTANTSILTGFQRLYPISGDTTYGIFTIQRNFAKRLDFTGRFIYSLSDREFRVDETVVGRDASNNRIDADILLFQGRAKRPQSRGDLGVTYAVTNKFRISNTFSFDQFDVTGDSLLNEQVISRTAAGAPRPTTFTNTSYYRLNGFKRFTNTIDGDYQFSPRFGINIGYRFSHRSVEDAGFNRPLAPSTSAATLIEEENDNSTSTLLIGTRVKPYKNWSIFADLERGESDNAFTRLSNYDFTNFRLRSNWNYKQFVFNVSGIIRNNRNPSQTSAITNTTTGAILVPAGELVGNVRNRVFSAYIDWTPDPRLSISTGFTYQHLTSETDIIVPLAVLTRGFSQFFMRDSFGFIDVTAQPIKRVSVFVSYRGNRDSGQGDRISNQANFIISSYPFRLHMPEARVAVKLMRNIDWNVGYQYYDYRENLQRSYFDPIPPNQNYSAHMPYTSLRIYFGGGDRGR